MLKPLDSKILLTPVERDEIIEDIVRVADIVSLGRRVWDFSRGDRVVLKKYAGIEFVYRDQEFILVEIDDIWGMVGFMFEGYLHLIGDKQCAVCWHDFPKPCDCGGLVHAEFGDENWDGDYWLYKTCDLCGDDYWIEDD